MSLRRVQTEVLRWAKAQMGLNMQAPTGMSTRTLVADGSKRREPQSLALVIQVLLEAVLRRQEVGEKRAEDPRPPLAEMGGNPGRKALEVRIAAVEEEAGVEGGADKYTPTSS